MYSMQQGLQTETDLETAQNTVHLKKSHNMISRRSQNLFNLKPYKCIYCRRYFYDTYLYLSHLTKHKKWIRRYWYESDTKEKLYKCQHCNKDFKRKQNWMDHECTLTFRKTFVTHLNRHSLIHSNEKPHVCKECNKGFKQACDLKRHIAIHGNEKPHVCKICNKGFTQAGNLKRHKSTHSNEKPHVCKICNKGFKRACDLKKHMTVKQHGPIHCNEKPYVCKVCNKGFIGNLNQQLEHEAIHSKEQPYVHVCEVCKQSFTQAHYLKRHKAIHGNEKPYKGSIRPYKCGLCNKEYKYMSGLKIHSEIHIIAMGQAIKEAQNSNS
ncbi:uncharacterized protein [Amphiura filiformis]|uniref:uncharacterized protein n=1 Tax=Amphiura filiformis TaxID=82378 RepID=UPI003B223121